MWTTKGRLSTFDRGQKADVWSTATTATSMSPALPLGGHLYLGQKGTFLLCVDTLQKIAAIEVDRLGKLRFGSRSFLCGRK